MRAPESYRVAADKLNKIAAMTPIPSKAAVKLATGELRIAKLNLDRSGSEYHSHHEYAQSATQLQQGVEKTAKSWHLLACFLLPTDKAMRSPSHEAYRLWVPNILPFYGRIREISTAVSELATSLPTSNFLLRRSKPMAKQAAEMVPELEPEKMGSLDRDLREMDNLHHRRPAMWKASMNVDTNNKWIRDAVNSLNQADVVSGTTLRTSSMVLRLIAAVKLLDKTTPARISFTMALGRSMKDTLWLPLLTSWHDETARYEGAPDSYWDSTAYVRSAPFVKLIPTLVKHGQTMNKFTKNAAKVAAKLA